MPESNIFFSNERAINFDDVLIVPESDVYKYLPLDEEETCPIIASPMDSIINVEMLNALSEVGAVGIHHRYCTPEEQIEAFNRSVKKEDFIAAVGSFSNHKDYILTLARAGIRHFALDVAYGARTPALQTLKFLRDEIKAEKIISGSIATPRDAKICLDYGANLLRVGIGSGTGCTTQTNLGVGLPTLYSVLKIAREVPEAIIIADGGIRSPGSAGKALIAGARYVMMGWVFSGTLEAPRRAYRGMASLEALSNRNDKKIDECFVEGKEVDSKGPFCGVSAKMVISQYMKGLRHICKYVGCNSVNSLGKYGSLAVVSRDFERERL